jgi:hypothetical protein
MHPLGEYIPEAFPNLVDSSVSQLTCLKKLWYSQLFVVHLFENRDFDQQY